MELFDTGWAYNRSHFVLFDHFGHWEIRREPLSLLLYHFHQDTPPPSIVNFQEIGFFSAVLTYGSPCHFSELIMPFISSDFQTRSIEEELARCLASSLILVRPRALNRIVFAFIELGESFIAWIAASLANFSTFLQPMIELFSEGEGNTQELDIQMKKNKRNKNPRKTKSNFRKMNWFFHLPLVSGSKSWVLKQENLTIVAILTRDTSTQNPHFCCKKKKKMGKTMYDQIKTQETS